MNQILPSILNAPLDKIQEILQTFTSLNLQTIHLDVMDGHFVPKISFGDNLVSLIKEKSSLMVEAHLMVSNPEAQIPFFIDCGCDEIIFHLECTAFPIKIINNIKNIDSKIKVGVAVNPGNFYMVTDTLLPYIDTLLLMTVNPGFGKQRLIKEVLKDCENIHKKIVGSPFSNLKIELDGGINYETIQYGKLAGATKFVVGSYLYQDNDIHEQYNKLIKQL